MKVAIVYKMKSTWQTQWDTGRVRFCRYKAWLQKPCRQKEMTKYGTAESVHYACELLLTKRC